MGLDCKSRPTARRRTSAGSEPKARHGTSDRSEDCSFRRPNQQEAKVVMIGMIPRSWKGCGFEITREHPKVDTIMASKIMFFS